MKELLARERQSPGKKFFIFEAIVPTCPMLEKMEDKNQANNLIFIHIPHSIFGAEFNCHLIVSLAAVGAGASSPLRRLNNLENSVPYKRWAAVHLLRMFNSRRESNSVSKGGNHVTKFSIR
jgi:hypothetical protein